MYVLRYHAAQHVVHTVHAAIHSEAEVAVAAQGTPEHSAHQAAYRKTHKQYSQLLEAHVFLRLFGPPRGTLPQQYIYDAAKHALHTYSDSSKKHAHKNVQTTTKAYGQSNF